MEINTGLLLGTLETAPRSFTWFWAMVLGPGPPTPNPEARSEGTTHRPAAAGDPKPKMLLQSFRRDVRWYEHNN